jgi:hypothetical protein
LHLIVGQQAYLPHAQEDAGLDPFLKAVVGGGAGTKDGGVQGLPLAAGAQHIEDGLHAGAVVRTWPAPAEAVRVLVDRD